MNLVHRPSFRLNSALFVVFLGLSVALWRGMPERYPVHFTLQGSPTRWAEGPGMWIPLVALCPIAFGKLHLFQRCLVSDPGGGPPQRSGPVKLPSPSGSAHPVAGLPGPRFDSIAVRRQ